MVSLIPSPLLRAKTFGQDWASALGFGVKRWQNLPSIGESIPSCDVMSERDSCRRSDRPRGSGAWAAESM
eukprot:764212-Hanusia_phi.AAC.2